MTIPDIDLSPTAVAVIQADVSALTLAFMGMAVVMKAFPGEKVRVAYQTDPDDGTEIMFFRAAVESPSILDHQRMIQASLDYNGPQHPEIQMAFAVERR